MVDDGLDRAGGLAGLVDDRLSRAGRLAGKVALITGAGAGIARASARIFAREGARVVIAELDAASGCAAEAELRAAGGEALFVETDVTKEESVAAALAAALSRFGALHVLFNCAGGSLPTDAPVTEVDLAVFEQTLGLNLRGTFLCCRHAIPAIVRAGGGSVVNTSSIAALRGDHPLHAYTAAKGAILSLTRALAGRYSRQGVRVNAICPGLVMTERLRKRMGATRGAVEASIRASGGMSIADHPFSIGEPEDIANVALFLASDESRMINAATISAEGGLSAY
jgi:NAD(P)-dependent dehydrogenase (short-subunit alcohol dehydrogenase family)